MGQRSMGSTVTVGVVLRDPSEVNLGKAMTTSLKANYLKYHGL